MVLENLITLSVNMCEYTFALQALLLAQFLAHAMLFSMKSTNSGKFHGTMMVASPVALFFFGSCLNMVVVSSFFLGLSFVILGRIVRYGYLRRNR